MLRRADTVTAIVLPGRRKLRLRPGQNLFGALAPQFPDLPGPCGGRGLCGLCRVRIEPPPAALEIDRSLIPARVLRDGWRLACRHTLDRPASITLPGIEQPTSLTIAGRRISRRVPFLAVRKTGRGTAIFSGSRLLERTPGATRPLLGAALDIGTTNVTLQLIDISLPMVLGTAVAPNPQAVHGDDVLSRITAAARPGGLARLQRLIIDTVNGLARSLKEGAHGAATAPLYEVALASNPVMACLFAGIDPSPLAVPPFAPPPLPSVLEGMHLRGLDIHPRGLVRILPAAQAFIGGDITGGFVQAQLAGPGSRPAFYLDLGTNGEMLLAAPGGILGASTAAGPALEGARISCGMPAGSGAIDEAAFGADITVTVIGNTPPRGICGSGLLDLLAGLVRSGMVDGTGRLLSPAEAPFHPLRRLAARVVERGVRRAFLVASGPAGDILLTQADIRELQLAKGAIRAGIDVLLDEGRLTPERVRRVVVAGTFGFHLRAKSLVDAGFFPEGWEDRVEFIGNASLAGARQCLLDRAAGGRVRALSRRIIPVPLAADPRFREAFLRRLSF